MSVITLNVDEARRTLSSSDKNVFVINDKNVDIVRFALMTGFVDIALDEHSALRVMYQRPGEAEVRAQTLTYYDTDGIRNFYDWELLSADLAKSGTLTVALCILRTDSEVEEWHTTPCQIRVLDTIHTDDSDEGDETITPTVAERVAVLETMIQRVASGAPIVVASTSDMTDTDKIYVLSTDGKWYYHNGSAWVAGGEYGAVSTDTTLTQSGIPADAKVVGDAINAVTSDVEEVQDALEHLDVETDKTLSVEGKPADAKAVGDALNAVTSDVGEVQDALENLNDAIIEKTISAPAYDSTSTYNVGDYCSKDGVIYKCTEPITTAEAWNASHWTAITGNEMIADMNDKLNMLVTSQVVEQPPAPEDVQCVNPADILSKSTATRMYVSKVDVSRDGIYYGNPYSTATLFYIHLFNEYGEELTITDKNGDQVSRIPSVGGPSTWFTIENHRVLKTFVRNGVLGNTYTASGDISYFGSPDSTMYFSTSNSNYNFGITYGEHYDEYIQYSSTPDVPVEYELNYNIELARYVQAYMQNHGTAVSNNMFNFFHPESDNTEFVNAVKYYHERAERQRNRVIRIGSFNKFVSRGQANWSTIKQELADYSIDICGFQECAAMQSGGVVTTQIGEYLKGWQFADYAVQDAVVDKALVSHWEVTQTDLITLLTYDNNAGTSNCIHALITIDSDKYYSHAVNANATLSVYCYHGKSSGATVGGTAYSSFQIRQMEIDALLAIVANDTADFIVIVGDTNAFETGFDIPTGTHHEWEMFRNAGFTPVLDGHDSTVTADLQDKYFCKASNNEVYCIACYDQIFIGSNITVENFGVIDSNLYPVESLGNVPVSDHCMVYADLKFDFDAVMQAKLREIAITQPWW